MHEKLDLELKDIKQGLVSGASNKFSTLLMKYVNAYSGLNVLEIQKDGNDQAAASLLEVEKSNQIQ